MADNENITSQNNAQNVSTGKPKITGAIWRAPLGTALPTDAIGPLNEAFKCVGYIAEGGVTNDDNIETDSYRAWGGAVVITYQTEKTDDFSWSMIEALNPDTLKAYHGDSNVTGNLAEGITVRVNAKDLEECVYIIDMNLRNAYKRIVIPDAKVAEKGEIVYEDADIIAYPMKITAQEYAAYDGDTHREYIKAAS